VPQLHDTQYKAEIVRRLKTLRPDSERKWGKMSVAQMLWHVNESMACAVGEIARAPAKAVLPKSMMKFLVLNMPWMKGAPTVPQWVAKDEHDFATERDRCIRLIEAMAARRIDGHWSDDPLLGRMTGGEVSRLHAKHLNHHLTQFGA
jgi:Protein of unknown function (DUF1569)